MTGAIILTVIIVIAIYFYMSYISKRNRSRTADIDSVKAYHDTYKRDRTRKNIQKTDNAFRTYVTKYNSKEDYRERGKHGETHQNDS